MNRMEGRIAAVEASGSVVLVDVDVGAQRYCATLLGAERAAQWQPGKPVVLLFKETEVALAKNLTGLISLRNRVRGRVTALERGRILSCVRFEADGRTIAAVITSRSLDLLGLAVGDEVEGLIKANEISVVEVA